MITKLRLVLTFIENKVYADGDSPSVKAKKKAALVFGLFMVVIYPIYLTYYILKPGEYYELLAPALTVACAPSIILFLYLLRTKCLPLYSVEAGQYSVFFGMVIMMDVLLLANCDMRASYVLLFMGCLYISLFTIDQIVDFGLFSFFPDGVRRPEKVSTFTGINMLANKLVVFTFDFAMTRYCAVSMYKEQERMSQMVSLAESVGKALGSYHLEEAGLLIDKAEQRGDSQKLCAVLTTLMQNLDEYRAYLPHSVMCGESLNCNSIDTNSDTHSEGDSSFPKLSRFRDEQQRFDDDEDRQVVLMRRLFRGKVRRERRSRVGRLIKSSRFVQGLGWKYISVVEVRLLHDDSCINAGSGTYLCEAGELFLRALFDAADCTKGLVVSFNALSASVVFGVMRRISQAQTIQLAHEFTDQIIDLMRPSLDFITKGGLALGIGTAEGNSIVGYVGTKEHSSFNVLGAVPRNACNSIQAVNLALADPRLNNPAGQALPDPVDSHDP